MKKPKLKAVLQKALKAKPAQVKKGVPAPQQHHSNQDPANMTVRHSWTDGLETDIPYRSSESSVQQHILVLGDGDLSFSAGLAGLLDNASCLIATTLDKMTSLEEKYGADVIQENLQALEEAGACVLHGIDATKLHLNKQLTSLKYSTVIFNYPHTGQGIKDRDRNIRAQQTMLKAFFGSVVQILTLPRLNKTVKRSALLRGKSAPLLGKRNRQDSDLDDEDDVNLNVVLEPEVHVTIRTGDPYDDWNVKGLAVSAGLRSAESFRFESAKYPGYRHVKTIGQQEEPNEEDFLSKPAKTFVFRLAQKPQ